MKLLLAIAICFLGFNAFNQSNYQDSLVTVHGSVKDSIYNVGFYDLVVVNKSVGKGIFGNSDGSFSITVKKKDKIGISVVGYQTIYLSFADSSFKKSYNINLFIESLEFTGKEVIVKPLKTLDELKEERLAIAKREIPVVTVANAISSPITALYVAFSKRERTKRRVAEMEFQDQQDDIVREILRIYVHNDIVDLNADDYDEFIRFLNLNTDFLKRATDYELITYIQEKFEHFEKIKEGF